MNKNIFRHLNNNEIELDSLQKEIAKTNDIIERLLQEDEFISCGNCGDKTKISRVKFRLETIDSHTKCNGCDKKYMVKEWKCMVSYMYNVVFCWFLSFRFIFLLITCDPPHFSALPRPGPHGGSGSSDWNADHGKFCWIGNQ